MLLHDIEQGTPAWLALRKTHRTASESAMVMDQSPFGGPAKLWALKKGIETPFVNHAMRQGSLRENEVRQKAADFFGEDWEPIVATAGSYLASLDGISADGETILEIKVSKKTYQSVKDGIIPAHYQIQMQHQLMVCNADKNIMAAMDPDTGDVLYKAIERDPNVFKEIRRAWDQFWPLLELETWHDPDEVQHSDSEWAHAAAAYLEAKQAREVADKLEKEAKANLERLSGGEMVASGSGLTLSRIVRLGSVDYMKFLADQDIIPSTELLDQYRRPATMTTRITATNEAR